MKCNECVGERFLIIMEDGDVVKVSDWRDGDGQEMFDAGLISIIDMANGTQYDGKTFVEVEIYNQ